MQSLARVSTITIAALLFCTWGSAQTEGESEGSLPAVAETAQAPAPDAYLDAIRKEYDQAGAASPDSTSSGNADGGGVPAPGVDGVQAFQTFILLCVVLAAIILLGYAVRRFGGKTPLLAGAQLGQIMGKVYLSPKNALVYVKSGGRVLVLGQTPTNITLVTEFDAEAFDDQLGNAAATVQPANGNSFLDQMRTTTARMGAAAADDEADIDSIRGDLQRLQQFLEESKRDGEG